MFSTAHDIEGFVREFEARTLPKADWTHHAHLVVGFWYLSKHGPDTALSLIRDHIRAYNEAVGTPNTDTRGYHETLTRLYLRGIQAHIAAHGGPERRESMALLLQSSMADKEWPLQFYSRERLFSVAARRTWIEPDRSPTGDPP